MESYSMTAGEFLSAGVPVLASNRGGLPEMVENGVDGLLFDPEDSAGLARMLQRIIDEPKVLSGLEPDRERVRSVDDEVDEWERSYAEGAA
jgi:glycosyltransferase involved in cell wall biosynthesis